MVNQGRLVDRLADDLRDEFEEVQDLAQGADLSQPTPAVGWDIGRTVGHLHATDLSARTAIVDPERFLADRPRRPDEFRSMHKRQLQHLCALSDSELLLAWRVGLDALLGAALAAPPGTKHPWYGPPLSIASSLTARIMEYWAHGEDMADGRGAERKPSSRLRPPRHAATTPKRYDAASDRRERRCLAGHRAMLCRATRLRARTEERNAKCVNPPAVIDPGAPVR